MYIKLVKNQKDIINSAIKKAGSYRKLSQVLNIPRSSLVGYKKGGAIPKNRFEKLINFLEIEKSSLETNKLEINWKQKLGGKACVKSKKEKGTFYSQLRDAQKSGVKGIKKWHRKMKKECPEKYYSIQYEKFKKIYGYKHKTIKGESVRNSLERDVANLLTEMGISYNYEPLVKIKNKWFFPDFVVGDKVILECTAWEGVTKAYQLLERIEHLKEKYQVFVVIPKHLYIKYKILDKHLIKGLGELVPVAQTFHSVKAGKGAIG